MLSIGILVLIALLVNLGLFYHLLRRLGSIHRDAVASWQSFVIPAEEGKASRLGEVTDAIAAVFANRLASSIMAAIRGSLGGQAKAMSDQVNAEVLAENPDLALVDLIPGLRKKLGKNPLALQALARIFNKAGMSGSGNHGSNPPKQGGFNLGI